MHYSAHTHTHTLHTLHTHTYTHTHTHTYRHTHTHTHYTHYTHYTHLTHTTHTHTLHTHTHTHYTHTTLSFTSGLGPRYRFMRRVMSGWCDVKHTAGQESPGSGTFFPWPRVLFRSMSNICSADAWGGAFAHHTSDTNAWHHGWMELFFQGDF